MLECAHILSLIMHFHTGNVWCDRYLKKLKDHNQNAQSRRSGEKAHHIYGTNKNTVMPHGRHTYAKASDMANSRMCTYPQSDHELPPTMEMCT